MILYYFKKVSVSVSLEFLLGNRWKHYAGGTVFQVFGNPDETCGFLKELLKSTSGIKKMEMFRNFSHLVMKNSNMCHWYSNQEMSSLEFDALLKSRVWRRIKLVDNASFQCFTRISNHMQMAKLISLGWTITLWKIKLKTFYGLMLIYIIYFFVLMVRIYLSLIWFFMCNITWRWKLVFLPGYVHIIVSSINIFV